MPKAAFELHHHQLIEGDAISSLRLLYKVVCSIEFFHEFLHLNLVSITSRSTKKGTANLKNGAER